MSRRIQEAPAPFRRSRLFHLQGASIFGATVTAYAFLGTLAFIDQFPAGDYFFYRAVTFVFRAHRSAPWVAQVEADFHLAWLLAGCIALGAVAGVLVYRAARKRQEAPAVHSGGELNSPSLNNQLNQLRRKK